jgi:hypothetical protein
MNSVRSLEFSRREVMSDSVTGLRNCIEPDAIWDGSALRWEKEVGIFGTL